MIGKTVESGVKKPLIKGEKKKGSTLASAHPEEITVR